MNEGRYDPQDAHRQDLAQPEGSEDRQHAVDTYVQWADAGELDREETALVYEIGGRALSWSQDCNEFEFNDEFEVREYIAGLSGQYTLEGISR
jgi:hypothetical protein